MRPSWNPSLPLLLLLSAPASVAAYPGAGSETPIPLEHQVTDLLTQSRFHQGQVWQGFVERNPGAWRVRFDERSGLAHQVWGEGIQLRDAAGTLSLIHISEPTRPY